MKFIPRNNQIVGRMTIRRSESKIVRLDETKVTKYLLVDAVGPDAAAKGVKVGDIVVVTTLRQIVLDAGLVFVPFAEEKDIALFVTDLKQNELLVQTLSGKEYVAFDSDEAAGPFGVSVGNNNAWGPGPHSNEAAVAGAPV